MVKTLSFIPQSAQRLLNRSKRNSRESKISPGNKTDTPLNIPSEKGPKNLSTSPSDPSFKSTTTNEEAEGGVLKSTKTDSTLDLPEDEIVPLIVEEHTYVKKRDTGSQVFSNIPEEIVINSDLKETQSVVTVSVSSLCKDESSNCPKESEESFEHQHSIQAAEPSLLKIQQTKNITSRARGNSLNHLSKAASGINNRLSISNPGNSFGRKLSGDFPTIMSLRSKSIDNQSDGLVTLSTTSAPNLGRTPEQDIDQAVQIILEKANPSTGRSRSGSLTHSPTTRRRPRKDSRTIETNVVTSKENYSGREKINQYVIKEELGRGSYGVVKLVVNRNSGKSYAMKTVSKKRLRKTLAIARRAPPSEYKSPNAARQAMQRSSIDTALASEAHIALKKENEENEIKREIAILKKLSHPNIVELVEVLDDPNDDNLYMVFDYMKQGLVMRITDKEICSPFSESVAKKFFVDLLLGIEYLHAQQVIHRDIKPSNLLLDCHYELKISDFGVSHIFEGSNDVLHKSAGSPAFTSPECLKADSNQYNGKPVDVWAMGVTLYCFIFGTLPFSSPQLFELHEQIKNDPVTFPQNKDVDPLLKDLICGMLRKSPGERLTIAEIRDHPWVTCNGEDPISVTQEKNTIPVEVDDIEVQEAFVQRRLSRLIRTISISRSNALGRSSSLSRSPSSRARKPLMCQTELPQQQQMSNGRAKTIPSTSLNTQSNPTLSTNTSAPTKL